MRYVTLILLLMVVMVSPIVAQDAESTEVPAVDARQILLDAQALVEQAAETQERNLDVANTILTAIQTGGLFVAVIATAVAIISGIFGFTSIRELRNQIKIVQEEVDSVEALKRDITNQMENVKREIELLQKAKDEVLKTAEKLSMMDDLPETVDNKMQEQKHDADRQMQALSLVQFAIQQISRGNRHAALQTLTRASDLQQDNAVIKYFQGEVLVRQGNYEAGIPYLEQAHQADMPDASATLAYAYRMMGDETLQQQDRYYSLSESTYLTLREKHPELLDITGESVYGGLAGLYRNRNMIDKAIAVYESIAEITPNSSYPINNLGLLHFEHDEKSFASRDKGKEYFEKARRKATVTLRLEGTDYWRFFDIITAEVALEVTQWETLKEHIDNMFDLEPIKDDIQKLVGGLRQLQKSEQPPRFVQQTIDYIQAQL